MKNILGAGIGVLLFIFILPIFCVRDEPLLHALSPTVAADALSPERPSEPKQDAPSPPAPPAEPIPPPKAFAADADTRVSVWNGSAVEDMDMHSYLVGVVAAEMPALYPAEALKAQAVAARSYTLYKLAIIEKAPDAMPEHHGAAVCNDYTHCKAFSYEDELRKKWGVDYEKYIALVVAAVNDTDGKVLVYDGEPIAAVFHSVSGGITETAADVWGSEVPYLVNVDSSGDRTAPQYCVRTERSPEEFKSVFSAKYPAAKLEGDPSEWFGVPERSPAGGVLAQVIGGVTVTGRELRALFGLRSANISAAYESPSIVMTTFGYGHGVGMSQYGAKYMADGGSDYAAILMHYYPGAELR